jgi:arginine/lysine/ornithine decarboxylase
MDNLHAPEGVIKELQEKISSIYGSDESYMLVNGSSSGITAAICATCNENTVLYADRSCHQSVFHGMVLSGVKPEYRCMEQADVVIVTSPSYEGKVIDIRALAEQAHARSGVLIVDEAHGAHFPFHIDFPEPAIRQNADIVINSFHKTLPAFNQTAALHVKGSRVDRDKLRFYLRVMQTSSPSYIFMAATDFMLDKITGEPEHFLRYADDLTRLRNALPNFKEKLPVTLFSRQDYEISKLYFMLSTNIDGKLIDRMLADEYGVQLEMSTESTLLAVTSVADTREGFEQLERAVTSLNQKLPFVEETYVRAFVYETPEIVLTPAQALNREAETVLVKEAGGRIAAEFVTEYPPGIPLLVPGERIGQEMITRLKRDRIKVVK